MNATVTDGRRRLVMPPELPARSAVTVQQVDEDTWIVKRQQPQKRLVTVVVAQIDELPKDPDWEKTEHHFVKSAIKGLSRFEE